MNKTGPECYKAIQNGMNKVSGVSSFFLGGDVVAFDVTCYVITKLHSSIIRTVLMTSRRNIHS